MQSKHSAQTHGSFKALDFVDAQTFKGCEQQSLAELLSCDVLDNFGRPSCDCLLITKPMTLITVSLVRTSSTHL